MKFFVMAISVILALGSLLPLWAQEPRKGLKTVSLMPQWIPQAQFAGYMVALEKGFYREAGIDLTLLQGGPDKPPLERLTSGQATFCTCWLANAIEERAAGKKIVCLSQIVQRSSLLLVARPDIKIPEDLNGRKVGVWVGHFYLQPLMFFRKHGIAVQTIPNYSSEALFLKGAVDAMAAMWYNEYHAILNSGINRDEVTVFFMNESGPNFPEDGLYAMEDTYKSDPEMCRDFVDASLRGWKWAFENQEQAIDIVLKYANAAHTGTNRPHQRWMLQRMRDLIMLPDGLSDIGKLKSKDYEYVGHQLTEYDFIKNIPSFEDFYRGPR
ncbi:MAG: NitT/TauT family transport system substrate-binding protein [Thermodesulfobacteriota bacterium]|nr:NitT/TauT family transport system substrate-binding protein [Thermodesulfobacteriota bacterium]